MPAIEDFKHRIRVLLGGRAAEEVYYGPGLVSAGAGDPDGSDLSPATHLAIAILAGFGFSKSGGLLWLDWDGAMPRFAAAEAIRNLPLGDDIPAEAKALLERLYGEAVNGRILPIASFPVSARRGRSKGRIARS